MQDAPPGSTKPTDLAVGAAAQHVVNGSHAVAMHHRLLDIDEHGSEHRL